MGLADDVSDILGDGGASGTERDERDRPRAVTCTTCGASWRTTDPPEEAVCEDCGGACRHTAE